MPKKKKHGTSHLGCRRKSSRLGDKKEKVLQDNNVTPTISEDEPMSLKTSECEPDDNTSTVMEYDFVVDAATVQEQTEQANAQVINMEKAKRLSIIFMFENKFSGTENDWDGKDGIIVQIRKSLGLKRGVDVRSILNDYIAHKILGIEYTGTRRMHSGKPGRKPTLGIESIEAQIVVDAIEDGLSFKKAWQAVNWHRKEESLPSVTFACVYSLLFRLQPKRQPVKELKQGTRDVDSNWARARLRWSTQLLIRYGELDYQAENPIKHTPVPPWYDKHLLTPLSPYGVIDWDEFHRKCTPGEGLCGGTKKHRLIFKRNQSGKIDLENGTYTEYQLSEMNCKYIDEIRFGAGVAMVKPLQDGTEGDIIVGRRARLFDYSSKTLVSVKEWNEKMGREMSRVQGLKSGGDWVKNPRPAGALYLDDKLIQVPSVGVTTEKKLAPYGIFTVADLLFMANTIKQKIVEVDKVFKLSKIDAIINNASKCSRTNKPKLVDHRKADNPYESRYGENWEKIMSRTAMLSPYVPITLYIEHIILASTEVFRDTAYANTWMFYHDALSLMTAKDTKKWMRDKGYLAKWILPEQNLYTDDPALKRYLSSIPGDSPELMSLDFSLNQDGHVAVDCNISATASLHPSNPQKFSLATPSKGSSAYRRVWDPKTGTAPCSHRIIEDRSRVVHSLAVVRSAYGAIVEDEEIRNASIRNGHRKIQAIRAQSSSSTTKGAGGARKRKLLPTDYGTMGLHGDALPAMRVKLELSRCAVDGSETAVSKAKAAISKAGRLKDASEKKFPRMFSK